MPKKKNTRSAQGAGTIRQRKDGRWEARITLGSHSGTGKQLQKSIYGNTQEEVLKKMREIQYEIDNGTYTEPMKITVGQWVETWFSEYTGNVKELTLANYRIQLNQHIRPAIGAVRLQSLTSPQIQGFYNSLTKGKHLSPKTVKNIHGVLHKALSVAVKIGYLRFNPADNITLPKIIKAEIKPLTDDKLTAFLDAIKGHQYEILFKVDLFTGMRKGEILGLTWDCVDFKQGTIKICKQLMKEREGKGIYKFAPLKNNKTRFLTPAPSVMSLLAEERRKQKARQLKAGTLWDNSMNLVFTNELGKHLSHTTISHNFKRIVTALGFPDARFHDLRHSYAVVALQSGDDVKTVQETLGHHTAAFTLDVYGHISERMKKESAERMERFIKSVNAQ